MDTENNSPYYRLEKIMEYYGLNPNAFANKIGLKRTQNLYDIRDGKIKKITFDLANKINTVFTAINKDWLLTGEGEMLVNDHAVIKEKDNDFKNLPIEEKLNIIYHQNIEINNQNIELKNQNIEIKAAIATNKETAENNKERIDDVMFILDSHTKMIVNLWEKGIKKPEDKKVKEIRAKN